MYKHKRRKNKDTQRNDKRNGDAQYQKIILNFMGISPKEAYNVKEIAEATELYRIISNQKIKSLLSDLMEAGKVTMEGKSRFKLGGTFETFVGRIEVYRGGMGYVIMENSDDIFIPQRSLGTVLNGDIVKVRTVNLRNREGKRIGEILEVVQRARTELVGILKHESRGPFYVVPDDATISFDFFLKRDALNGAKEGDKVYIQVTDWDSRTPECKVLEVLGKPGEHEVEMHAILLNYGFNPKFPEEVERFAQAIPEQITPEEIAKRRDFRQITTFTIDPIDAKDFDDAISFQTLENGNYEVGVHIADVSHYLKIGTILDMEAFKRATSVYLVDRTVPMLPEKLSNFLCSLRPNEEKLTYSAVFELDSKGTIHNEWFGRTLIYSDHRFSYEAAQDVIEGKQEGPFREELLKLNEIALALREARFSKGSIDFDTDEVRFELDENDKPIRLYVKERKEAHKLIEDFMLLANKRVATFIGKMFDNPPLTFVYRIHDKPDKEKLGNLQEFIKHFGYEENFAVADPSDAMKNLMKDILGKPEQNIIERIAIRSMAKAVYSTNNIGHFGLGFEYYSHFTSPIRRYPDVMVHRLLTQYLEKDYKTHQEKLEIECKHCSKMEKTAAEAERASIKYKQVEFMSEQIGKEFRGVISGVKESGFYVEMPDTLCEGMVPMYTISDDYYHYDEKALTLTGKHSGRIFRMGDAVMVKVIKTDLAKRQIDLEVVLEKMPKSKGEKEKVKVRRKH